MHRRVCFATFKKHAENELENAPFFSLSVPDTESEHQMCPLRTSERNSEDEALRIDRLACRAVDVLEREQCAAANLRGGGKMKPGGVDGKEALEKEDEQKPHGEQCPGRTVI